MALKKYNRKPNRDEEPDDEEIRGDNGGNKDGKKNEEVVSDNGGKKDGKKNVEEETIDPGLPIDRGWAWMVLAGKEEHDLTL